jgi:hypothetical protein
VPGTKELMIDLDSARSAGEANVCEGHKSLLPRSVR